MKRSYIVTGVALLILCNGVASADLTTGLVAYLPFSGNASDVTGNGYDGTVSGATLTTDRLGNANSAYYFDGGDYIQLANNFNFNSMAGVTVSAWIKSESTNGTVFHQGNGGELWLKVDDGKADMTVHTADEQWYGPTDEDLLPAQYVNVTGVYYPGDRVEVWVGGLMKSALTLTSGSLFDPWWGSYFYATVGAYHERGHSIIKPFTGSIDEFRVYSRALSGAEIVELSVPEPATLSLLALGGLALIRRRRTAEPR